MMMNDMLLSTILLAAQLSGGSAETLLRRRLAGVPVGPTACLTEVECRDRFTAMHTAGILTGYFYASGNFPTKGCVLKGESVYFGSGGTLEEMSSFLTAKKERLWCESTPVELDMSMSMGLTDMSIPLGTSEMSMSMGLTDMSVPLVTSEMSMSMGMTDMSVPLETSEMNLSEANTASVGASSAPPEDIFDDGAAAAENTNDFSATDAVTDPISDPVVAIPLGKFSIGDDAAKEPTTTPSGAVASSILSQAATFVVVTVTLAVFSV